MKTYKSQFDSFPQRTLDYLKEHGESKNETIREAIGLNDHCQYHTYSDRSGYYFSCLIWRLLERGVVIRTKLGYYKLSDSTY